MTKSQTWKTIKKGSKGNSVRRVKRMLRIIGYPLLDNDEFDKNMEAAVIAFQRENILKPDGIVGLATYTTITNYYNKIIQGMKTPKQNILIIPEKMQRGYTGEIVKVLKRNLKTIGYPVYGDNEEPSALFDTATERAVKNFKIQYLGKTAERIDIPFVLLFRKTTGEVTRKDYEAIKLQAKSIKEARKKGKIPPPPEEFYLKPNLPLVNRGKGKEEHELIEDKEMDINSGLIVLLITGLAILMLTTTRLPKMETKD